MYVEPYIWCWYWAHERDFVIQYFGFINKLAEIFRGLAVARMEQDGLLAWGAIDQADFSPEDYQQWSEDLKTRRFMFYEFFGVPIDVIRDAELRVLLLQMAREQFQQLSFMNSTIDMTEHFRFTVEEIRQALERQKIK